MEISTVTPIALGFILIFALVGALRGGLRVGASFLSFLAGGLLAFPLAPLAKPLMAATPVPLALQPVAALAAVGLAVFIALRIVFSIALGIRERKRRRQDLPLRSSMDRGLGALLGAAWGTLLVLVVLAGIGLVYDVQTAIEMPIEAQSNLDLPPATGAIRPDLSSDRIAEAPETTTPPDVPATGYEPASGPIATLGREVSSSVFGPLVEKASPLGKNQGETIRNFVSLLDDPAALERLRRQPEIQNLLQNPSILEATENPEIASAIRSRDLLSLLNHPTIAKLASDPELRQEILSLDLDGLLRRSKGY